MKAPLLAQPSRPASVAGPRAANLLRARTHAPVTQALRAPLGCWPAGQAAHAAPWPPAETRSTWHAAQTPVLALNPSPAAQVGAARRGGGRARVRRDRPAAQPHQGGSQADTPLVSAQSALVSNSRQAVHPPATHTVPAALGCWPEGQAPHATPWPPREYCQGWHAAHAPVPLRPWPAAHVGPAVAGSSGCKA